VLLAAAPELIRPTFHSSPARASSGGQEAVDLAARAGLLLDPWQAWVLEEILGERADGTLAAFEAALCVPRQNGKGTVLEALALYWLFVEEVELILWSAHEFKTAAEAFRRMRTLLQGAPDLWPLVARVTTANGDEAIELVTGQRLKFVARSKASGRGFTGDKIILDEAYDLDGDQIAALVPTMATRPNPQIIYTSSAGMADSDVLRDVRDRGRAGGDPSLCWMEWCATASGKDAKGRDVYDLDDRAQWKAANPSYGKRIFEAFIANLRRLMSGTPEKFGREQLGIWDAALLRNKPITPVLWAARCDPYSLIVGSITIGIDISPDRRTAAVAVAGRRADGLAHIELARNEPGTDWLVAQVVKMVDEQDLFDIVDGKVVRPAIVGDKLVLNKALVAAFRDEGIFPVVRGLSDLVAACSGLQDAFENDTIRHPGQQQLTDAIDAAVKRDVGDGGWAWGKKLSADADADISGVNAVTWAHQALTEVRDDGVWGFFE